MIITVAILANRMVLLLAESGFPVEMSAGHGSLGLCEWRADNSCKSLVYSKFLFESEKSL